MDLLQVKKNSYERIYNRTEPIKNSIDPRDVDKEAQTWAGVSEEKLHKEISKSVSVAIQESQHNDEIRHLAIHVWIKDMPRFKLEDLKFNTEKEAMKNGYRPYNTSDTEAVSIIYNIIEDGRSIIPSSAWDEAYSVVRSAIADRIHPNGVKGESMMYSFNPDGK